jgi:HAD superfamily hydrolase (TIGR01484 family)
MNHFNPQSEIAPNVLATDLDGTLIPLPEAPENERDMETLRESLKASEATLVFATGRHFESVIEAMNEYSLPQPDWIVCDVGSAIYKRQGDAYEVFDAYESHLAETSGGVDRQAIEATLDSIDGLELQPIDHQQRFKISYQSTAETVDPLTETVQERLQKAKLPYDCMGSLDPFLNCGLLDVMPQGVSKAYALLWLSTHANFLPDAVIYSGDSGNDYAALCSGFRAIIVANGSPGLSTKVGSRLSERNLGNRLYVSRGKATSGVLEGCRHFGLFDTTG